MVLCVNPILLADRAGVGVTNRPGFAVASCPFSLVNDLYKYLETIHRFNGISSFNEAISFNQYMNIKYKFLSLDLEETDSYVLSIGLHVL